MYFPESDRIIKHTLHTLSSYIMTVRYFENNFTMATETYTIVLRDGYKIIVHKGFFFFIFFYRVIFISIGHML